MKKIDLLHERRCEGQVIVTYWVDREDRYSQGNKAIITLSWSLYFICCINVE
jgi:hypothetical protein